MVKTVETKTVFDTLNAINVNEHTEKKSSGGSALTYLSWAWAWAETKKAYPDAQYHIVKFDGLPYVYDPLTGYMVYTTVTIGGICHEMWLPVMDGANKAMKAEPYEYNTYKGKKRVEAATMFDINKTIMRCLTKNLAMHGLGLYIFAGEDLPEGDDEQQEQQQAQRQQPATITDAQKKSISALIQKDAEKIQAMRDIYTKHKIQRTDDIKPQDFDTIYNEIKDACEWLDKEREAAGGLFNDWEANG